MSGFSSRHTINHVTDASFAPTVHRSSLTMVLKYLAGGLVLWIIGIQFTAGVHFAATGSPNFVGSIVSGLNAVLLGAVIAVILSLAKVHFRGIGFGVAIALAFIAAEAAFPIGAIVGSMWNSIAGSFPDISGLGNKMIEMIR